MKYLTAGALIALFSCLGESQLSLPQLNPNIIRVDDSFLRDGLIIDDRSRSFDDNLRGFDDSRLRGFDDSRSRGFDDNLRRRGFDDNSRFRSFDDSSILGVNHISRSRGLDDSLRGFDDSRLRGFDDSSRLGINHISRSNGLDDSLRSFDDSRLRGFDDNSRGIFSSSSSNFGGSSSFGLGHHSLIDDRLLRIQGQTAAGNNFNSQIGNSNSIIDDRLLRSGSISQIPTQHGVFNTGFIDDRILRSQGSVLPNIGAQTRFTTPTRF